MFKGWHIYLRKHKMCSFQHKNRMYCNDDLLRNLSYYSLLLVNANIGIRQENVIVFGVYVSGQLTYLTTLSSCAYMPNLRSKKRTTFK